MSRVHVSLPVSDLERSVRFYESLFARSPDKRKGDYANWRLDDPALMLALVAGEGGGDARRHYGVELSSASELADWRARVQAAGLAGRAEEQVTCCYAVADKLWLEDPDGNAWELWVRTADAATMREPAAKAGCCAQSS